MDTAFYNSGNVGIGLTDPGTYKFRVRGASPNLLRVETAISDIGQVSGIEFGIPNFPTTGSAKITSTAI